MNGGRNEVQHSGRRRLTEHNAGRGNAFVNFGFDQAVEVVAGLANAGFILLLGEVVESFLAWRTMSVLLNDTASPGVQKADCGIS